MFQNIIRILIFSLCVSSCGKFQVQEINSERIADKPLFRDPVYDGAADPVIIWNPEEEKHFMFYTNRRAKADTLDGVVGCMVQR